MFPLSIPIVTLFGIICLAPNAMAEGTAAPPRSTLEQMQPPEVTSRAATASAAAKASAKLAEWVNTLGLQRVIDRSLRSQDEQILHLLNSTGQPGVLVYIQIERIDAEVPVYYVVNDNVTLIGAGTSIDDVYFGYMQRSTLEGARSGAKRDIERSSFLWFTKSGAQIQVVSAPAMFVIYPAAQRLADAKIRESLVSAADARAIGLAVDYLESTTKSAELKKRIAALRSNQAETNRRIAQIESELQRALERARKAQVVANQLATWAAIFSIASQVGSAVSYMGTDSTPAVENAKTPEELKNAVDALLSDAITRRDNLQIRYKSTVDQKSATRMQYMEILTTGRYPTTRVPQIHP